MLRLHDCESKNLPGHRFSFDIDEKKYQNLNERHVIFFKGSTKGRDMKIQALRERQFVPFFQPQFNYITGAITGIEALARWIKSDGTIGAPKEFISYFEENGMIYELDRLIWEKTCIQLSEWKAKGYAVPSISVNVSRRDLYHEDLADHLCALLAKYGLEVKDLHLEVTESAYTEDTQQFLKALSDIKSRGFVIEMDDFGKGYSSLCALKDMPIDVLKLDGDFLTIEDTSSRCGKIITSVVNMAHSIDMPVIAEGVETKEEADFLKTIGCMFMQGYLFSRPLPADELEEIFLSNGGRGFEMKAFKGNQRCDGMDFFDLDSQNTLIFNSYVGGAAIITRNQNGKVSADRMNDMFLKLVGLSREEYAKRRQDLLAGFDAASAKAFSDALDDAIATGDETSCTTHSPDIDGKGRDFWSHNRLRLIAQKVGLDVFYLSIEDITESVRLTRRNQKLLKEIEEREDIFMNAAEQVDMFFWKYDIKSKDMYPCSRCQKNLDLPKLVRNYPYPAIEMCIFPEGDKYMEIMERVDRGEDIDEIMPLTKERVQYRVRYTVKRDADGNPSVAYATALPADTRK